MMDRGRMNIKCDNMPVRLSPMPFMFARKLPSQCQHRTGGCGLGQRGRLGGLRTVRFRAPPSSVPPTHQPHDPHCTLVFGTKKNGREFNHGNSHTNKGVARFSQHPRLHVTVWVPLWDRAKPAKLSKTLLFLVSHRG